MKAAVCLLACAGTVAMARADQIGSKPQPPPMIVVRVPFFEASQKWFQIVMAHDIGQWDKSAVAVAAMDPIMLVSVRNELRVVRDLLEAAVKGDQKVSVGGRTLTLQSLPALLGLTSDDLPVEPLLKFDDSPSRQIINRILTRGAMLHTRVAMQPAEDMPEVALPGRDITSRRLTMPWEQGATQIRDGKTITIADRAIHWAIAREAFDIVGPPRAGSAAARAWYDATIAWLQIERDYSALVPQLEHARELFPRDAQMFLFSGAASENLAAPPVQAAVTESFAAIGGLQRKDALLKDAETQYRRALGLDPASASAQLRLGHLLLTTNRNDEAAPLLAAAEKALTDAVMQYDAALFLGRAEESRGRDAEARAAYERARTRFPAAQSPALALAALAWRMGEQETAAGGVRALSQPNPTFAQSDPWWRYDIAHVGDVTALFLRLDAAVTEAMK